MLDKAIEMIIAQQAKAPDRSPIRLMGEQLKDICRTTPGAAELVAKDLEVPEMSLEHLKKKFDDFASAHKSGNQSCIFPDEADKLIREFYGLPMPGAVPSPVNQAPAGKVISLLDMM
ncbi:hypothetical protein [Acetanaerobacterium elongatum]|uniref:Uncharacterized protein n=1 Tax=Acetanaerobacterium elongatum TaxID=258515 RepID=A0A1G9YZQ4_9FIRM|nr:hypothetical protein [Acetanaerobacterium elongatum]SDN14407.1 hypothetical protein SAMN05192585_11235 [Acetanaerobacterium elongatum]